MAYTYVYHAFFHKIMYSIIAIYYNTIINVELNYSISLLINTIFTVMYFTSNSFCTYRSFFHLIKSNYQLYYYLKKCRKKYK